MQSSKMKILIIFKIKSSKAKNLAQKATDFLLSKDHQVFCEENQQIEGATPLKNNQLDSEINFVTVIGGDGTLLYSTSLMTTSVVPILGINLGSLGFLTPFSSKYVFDHLHQAINNQLIQTRRFRIDVKVLRNQKCIFSSIAANDAVINHKKLARLMTINCYENNEYISTYKADGLILATPMGSTAYALAAGGPIISPQMDALAIVPICPHQLTQRPLIIDSSSELTVNLEKPGFLTVDGQRGQEIEPSDKIILKKSQLPIKLFLPNNYSIFKVLKHKLSWGAREAFNA
jgi:NAD+ kinase